MDVCDDQQFCLRWNNFQANITSQFETLRDDEDFTDVTIACDGQRLEAHKVVLSACSPYFKELFKNNPCSHPIIFMRDVEAKHIMALMEFMYAGEVNVNQAQLSSFLKTAESLKIRGLTDTTNNSNHQNKDTLFLNPRPLSELNIEGSTKFKLKENTNISCSSTVTSSQDIGVVNELASIPSPIANKQCKLEPDSDIIDEDLHGANTEKLTKMDDLSSANSFLLPNNNNFESFTALPKLEHVECIADDDRNDAKNFYGCDSDMTMPDSVSLRRNSENCSSFDFHNELGRVSPDDLSSATKDQDRNSRRNRLVKLSDGIEIYEDQLRSIKWNDYRKLTRGLATILFSPDELARCSVTGQRWSRAGSGERPVKPALDRPKVQAIISYVATRFPMIEISRIKQVLAYKCKENSTAFKMKAVRYYGEHIRELNL